MRPASAGALLAAPARAVGLVAWRALAATRGRARVLARPGGAAFLTAGDEIVWLGPATAPLHPRAVLVNAVPDVAVGSEVGVDLSGLRPWEPRTARLDADGLVRLRAGWPAAVTALGTPAGFGALLVGAALVFPLDGALARAQALARACAADDPDAALAPALGLLGLGGGLTPSGDDLVGGALFARHHVAAAGLADAPGWRRVADALGAAARSRTHPISAALLADLAGGSGHAPLHDLVAALAGGAEASARQAAGQLTRLGHSSGWDILAGVAIGFAIAA